MPACQHVASTHGPGNGYRVLGSGGRPRADFRWDSPDDIRDVIGVLREDGVRFRGNGAAGLSSASAASSGRMTFTATSRPPAGRPG